MGWLRFSMRCKYLTRAPAEFRKTFLSFSNVVYSFIFPALRLTLRKPFYIQSVEAHREAIYKRGERPPLEGSGIPHSLQNLLINCWNGNIVHRFSMKEAKSHLSVLHSEFTPGLLTAESLHKCLSSTRKLLSPLQDAFESFANDVQTGYDGMIKDFSGRGRLTGGNATNTLHTVMMMGTTHTGDDDLSSCSGLSFADDEDDFGEDLWLANMDEGQLGEEEDLSLITERQEVTESDLVTNGGLTTDKEPDSLPDAEASDATLKAGTHGVPREEEPNSIIEASAPLGDDAPAPQEEEDCAKSTDTSAVQAKPNPGSLVEPTEEESDDLLEAEDSDTAPDAITPKSFEEEEPNSIIEDSACLDDDAPSQEEGHCANPDDTVDSEEGKDPQANALEEQRRRRQAPRGRNGTLVYHRFYGHVESNKGKATEESSSKIYRQRTLWFNHWAATAA